MAGGKVSFILGPWRWMLIVYRYDGSLNEVTIVTLQDGRSSRAPTSDVLDARKPEVSGG